MKFYTCNQCKTVLAVVNGACDDFVCGGEKMQLLVPGTVAASVEKHTPAVTVEENLVKVAVGSVAHPMTEEHYIEWIYLETCCGGQFKYLKPNDAPETVFNLNGQKPVAVYAYCNLHGLLKKEL